MLLLQVINGAQLFYPEQFGIANNSALIGLVNSGPYLACAVLGCWLTAPLNNYFGRRGAIFVTATLSFLTCIWAGVTNTWWHLFISRFVLGLGIGPKSATVPIYAAECSPAPIRGALVMMWQMFTAFGECFRAFDGLFRSSRIFRIRADKSVEKISKKTRFLRVLGASFAQASCWATLRTSFSTVSL